MAFQYIKSLARLLCLTGVIGAMPIFAAAEENLTTERFESAGFKFPSEAPSGRQYAPDRDVQMIHIALDVTPDFKQRTIEGRATITFKPLLKPVREIKLNAVDLDVSAVTATEKKSRVIRSPPTSL